MFYVARCFVEMDALRHSIALFDKKVNDSSRLGYHSFRICRYTIY